MNPLQATLRSIKASTLAIASSTNASKHGSSNKAVSTGVVGEDGVPLTVVQPLPTLRGVLVGSQGLKVGEPNFII
jgi:hypothetical protein